MSKVTSINIPPTNHIKVLDEGQGWIGLINNMGNESTITNAARVSFCKMKNEFDEKDEMLLKYLIDNKHLTPLEHVVFTFSVHCPLFVRGQWMRHRMGSFNEISRRYTNVDMEIYKPSSYRKQSDNNKQASIEGTVIDNNESIVKKINEYAELSVQLYESILEEGVCKEQARGILPQNMMTTFWWTVNLRSLVNFLQLRDDDHAQIEIREYAIAIKKLIKPYIPHVIEYYGWKTNE